MTKLKNLFLKYYWYHTSFVVNVNYIGDFFFNFQRLWKKLFPLLGPLYVPYNSPIMALTVLNPNVSFNSIRSRYQPLYLFIITVFKRRNRLENIPRGFRIFEAIGFHSVIKYYFLTFALFANNSRVTNTLDKAYLASLISVWNAIEIFYHRTLVNICFISTHSIK